MKLFSLYTKIQLFILIFILYVQAPKTSKKALQGGKYTNSFNCILNQTFHSYDIRAIQDLTRLAMQINDIQSL